MSELDKKYQTTKEECQSMIRGVCDGCGGELIPLETEDNSGNPTYWAGCESCSKFCNGVPQEIFDIAKMMVVTENFIAYHHMDDPYDKDEEYARYWLDSQTAGAVSVVRTVFRCKAALEALKGDL